MGSVLNKILDYYGMPKENIEAAVEQIAETYGACRYLDGVNAGVDVIIGMDEELKNEENETHDRGSQSR